MKQITQIYIMCIIIFIAFLTIISGNISAEDDMLVYQIPIQGEIDPGMVNIVKRGIKEAEEAGADSIIFNIDTFGGLVNSAIQIRDAILQTRIYTITYVSNRAWSAGALIALSGNELVMVEGSSIGAAETRPREEKYVSALRNEFKATAEIRNKNSELAEAMVDSDVVIEDIIDKGKLLTLTAGEAQEYQMSDLIVSDYNQLIEEFGYINAGFVDINFTPAEKLAKKITGPVFSVLLLTLGFVALMFEALAPGWGVGGTVGILSLSLFFSSHVINGYAGWGLVILFLAGLGLLFLELFVIPGFGITGVGGIAAIITSLVFTFPSMEMALSVLAMVMVFSLIGFYILLKMFGSTRIWKKISLGESQTQETGYIAQSDKKEIIGKEGKAETSLRPTGIALIENKRMDVITEGDYISKGEKIKVIEVKGNRVVVKKTN